MENVMTKLVVKTVSIKKSKRARFGNQYMQTLYILGDTYCNLLLR